MTDSSIAITPNKPGAALRKEAYVEQVSGINKDIPNVMILPDLDTASLLISDRYHYSAAEFLDALPCREFVFNKTFRPDLPCLMLTKQVRAGCPGAVKSLSPMGQKAKYLYAAEDVVSLFPQKFETTLSTVRMPLSLFAKNPTVFRHDFLIDRQNFLNECKGNQVLMRPRTRRAFNRETKPYGKLTFPSVSKHIPPSVIAELEMFLVDNEEEAKRQQVKDPRNVKLPSHSVCIPENVFPVFYHLDDVARFNNCGIRSSGLRYVKRDGWVSHVLKGTVIVGYTRGPLLGETKHWLDYKVGATVTMTFERAVKLLGGEESITHTKHWLLGEKDIFWQEGDFVADDYMVDYDPDWLG